MLAGMNGSRCELMSVWHCSPPYAFDEDPAGTRRNQCRLLNHHLLIRMTFKLTARQDLLKRPSSMEMARVKIPLPVHA